MAIYSRPNELLSTHEKRVFNGFNNLVKSKNIDKILSAMLDSFLGEENLDKYKDFVYELMLGVLKYHDIGKNSAYFQSYVGNDEYKDVEFTKLNKEHSYVSAYYYLENYKKSLLDMECASKGDIRKLKSIVAVFSYIIAKHHTGLGNYKLGDYLQEIENRYKMTPESFCFEYNTDVIRYFKSGVYTFSSKKWYILSRFVYSILVTCDFMAVHEYSKCGELKINSIDSELHRMFSSKLESSDIVSNIRAYEKRAKTIPEIDAYRSDMFLESERNKSMFNKTNICYIEAPTGSGKSVTALNIALGLIDDTINSVTYVAPFTNIIEQTSSDMKRFIGTNKKNIVSVTYKDEIVTEQDDLTTDFDVDYMDNLLLNYPVTVVSHVKIFDALFGCSRRSLLALPLLANSVIVLDEIQSYKNKIWVQIINMLKEYAEALNIKILIMSATLPKMQELLDDKSYSIESLIDDSRFYYDFFKNRVEFDYSLLDSVHESYDDRCDALIESISKAAVDKKRILVGTITISTCDFIYNKLCNIYKDTDYKVLQITGSTSLNSKNNIIDALKRVTSDGEYAEQSVILVSTQSIEAGVDIDMDIGFKNIGLIDSDEQFCGRIARNFKSTGIVYFYKIDEVSKIYNDDYRSEKTLETLEWRAILKDKLFDEVYNLTYKRLLKSERASYEKFCTSTHGLKFLDIEHIMRLIDDKSKVSILTLSIYTDSSGASRSVSDDISDYTKLLKSDKRYSEKMILLSRYKRLFDSHSRTINKWDLPKVDIVGKFGVYNLIKDS